jgi:hypothetical protein
MNLFKSFSRNGRPSLMQRAIPYGASKKDGSHDHRYNKGTDRTSAQKQGDTKRTKP